MISYIRGLLVSKREESIIVECQHMGYEIFVPLSVLSRLPSIGNEVKIHTELYVREDIIKLYGFIAEEDIDIFRQLISVSGIGPKGALGILSSLTPDALKIAILTDNVDLISQAKGIGKKTASKIILELKDKMKAIDLGSGSFEQEGISLESSLMEDAILALTSLGYSQTEAVSAMKHIKDRSTVTTIIKEALAYLAKE
jgi:holliday junction DNA helicase RuvA